MRPLRERSTAPTLSAVPDAADVSPPAVEPDETGLDAGVEAQAQAELEAEIEAEVARSLAESLTQEIAQAEDLVLALDRDLHGGVARHERRFQGDGRSDDELVQASRTGDDAALAELLTKYRAFARVKARSYFLVGADREDIVQEGMIGLYKAIRDFNPEMQTSFRAFAELCVTRQIITAIKTATRQKHGPLNNYVSFSRPVGADGDGGDGDRVLADVLPTIAISDPADLVISAERIRALQAHFDEVLSDLETEVLRLYVEGKSYQEIAERLQRHVKSIDNALQRIKRKLEGHLRDRNIADAG